MAMRSSSFPQADDNQPNGQDQAGWNLFARTLEDLLRAHDDTPLTRLDDLRERPGEELAPDDLDSPFELVHREKVRRLILSLRQPGLLPILSRDDLERIRRYFRFTHDEVQRLQAAILATHIQRTVSEWAQPNDNPAQRLKAASVALRAAELLLPTLAEALRTIDDDDPLAFRGPALAEGVFTMTTPGAASQPADERAYAELASALDAIDRATLALSLSYHAPVSAERLERARAARSAFSDALEQLDEQEAWVRASEPWRVWHAEARRGYHEADERVVDLGG